MIDVLDIGEIEQSEVNPETGATTIHTGLNLPDGGEGFLIIGRIIRKPKKEKWLPLKEVISKIFVEYDKKYDEVPAAAEENPIRT